MIPTMSLHSQNAIHEQILEYAEYLSKGFIPKDNIPNIIAKSVIEVSNELQSNYNLKKTLSNKYSTQLVNAYVQRVMGEINR